MKRVNTNTIATLALTAAMSIGTASAMGLDIGTKPLTSVPGVTGTNISVKVDDGVATLFGNTDSSIEAQLAKSYVERIEGVDRVINLVTYN